MVEYLAFWASRELLAFPLMFLYNVLAFRGFLLTQNDILVVAFPVLREDGPHAFPRELSGQSCN